MAKDPAVLWYWNDWAGGTKTFSRFLKGCYMDLLDAQFNCGELTLDEIKTVLGSDFGSSWPALQKKFKVSNGLYFNERLTFEKIKRQKYSKSRSDNRNSEQHMSGHMENENEIKIDNEDLIKKYGEEMILEFLTYWNEPNKKGKRKWELEKTWSLEGRLFRWFKNINKYSKPKEKKENKSPSAYQEAHETFVRSIINEDE